MKAYVPVGVEFLKNSPFYTRILPTHVPPSLKAIARRFHENILRRRSTTATAVAATEGRSELARGALLALRLTTAVTTVTTGASTGGVAAATLVTHHATRRSVRALLLDVGGRDDLSREVEPLAEVVETLGGEGVVVVLPGELGLEVAPGGQGLAGLDDLLNLEEDIVRSRVSRLSAQVV